MTETARLRALLAEATPGPWSASSDGDMNPSMAFRLVSKEAWERRAATASTARPAYLALIDTRENAEAIIAAMAALPALLDRLEAAEAVVEAAREVDRRRQDHGRDADAETAMHDALRRYDEVPRG